MFTFMAGNIFEFEYENYKGRIARRKVKLVGLNYGSNEWYSDEQWFAYCYDYDKKDYRSFALAKINPRKVEATR